MSSTRQQLLPGLLCRIPVDDVARRLTRHLRRRHAHAPSTLEPVPRRLAFAVRDGFNLGAFMRGRAAALEAGDAYLEHREWSTGPSGYTKTVQLLNHLAAMQDYRGVKWAAPPQTIGDVWELAPDEIQRLFSANRRNFMAKARALAILQWALCTGMRGGEIVHVDYQDLDDVGRRFHVRHPTKRGKKRSPPVVFPDILDRSSWFQCWREARPIAPEDPDAIFTTLREPVRRLDERSLYAAVYQLGKSVGVPVSFFRTRHTFATQFLDNGGDIRDLQVLMGHADISSTMRYDDRSVGRIYRRIEQMDMPRLTQ